MPAPLSIIIPTLNAAPELGATLACLVEGLDSGLLRELVISDGGSRDDIAGIAEGIGATLVTGSAGRGGQLARGARMARGDWLLFLHADTHLSPGWSGAVFEHIRRSDDAACFRLRFRAPGLGARLVAGGANLRARLGLPYGDQGLLMSRALYDEVGGFADIALMEDVAMARKLRRRLVMLPCQANTGAERYQRGGWLRRPVRNLWTLARYLGGASPEKLARFYRK
jgi:rSAM/selenodomain-associated transferase 2